MPLRVEEVNEPQKPSYELCEAVGRAAWRAEESPQAHSLVQFVADDEHKQTPAGESGRAATHALTPACCGERNSWAWD